MFEERMFFTPDDRHGAGRPVLVEFHLQLGGEFFKEGVRPAQGIGQGLSLPERAEYEVFHVVKWSKDQEDDRDGRRRQPCGKVFFPQGPCGQARGNSGKQDRR